MAQDYYIRHNSQVAGLRSYSTVLEPTSVTCSLSAATMLFGQTVTSTITLNASKTGLNAAGTYTLQASKNQSTWTDVISDSVNGFPRFAFFSPPFGNTLSRGTWFIRVVYSGNSNYSGSTSPAGATRLIIL